MRSCASSWRAPRQQNPFTAAGAGPAPPIPVHNAYDGLDLDELGTTDIAAANAAAIAAIGSTDDSQSAPSPTLGLSRVRISDRESSEEPPAKTPRTAFIETGASSAAAEVIAKVVGEYAGSNPTAPVGTIVTHVAATSPLWRHLAAEDYSNSYAQYLRNGSNTLGISLSESLDTIAREFNINRDIVGEISGKIENEIRAKHPKAVEAADKELADIASELEQDPLNLNVPLVPPGGASGSAAAAAADGQRGPTPGSSERPPTRESATANRGASPAAPAAGPSSLWVQKDCPDIIEDPLTFRLEIKYEDVAAAAGVTAAGDVYAPEAVTKAKEHLKGVLQKHKGRLNHDPNSRKLTVAGDHSVFELNASDQRSYQAFLALHRTDPDSLRLPAVKGGRPESFAHFLPRYDKKRTGLNKFVMQAIDLPPDIPEGKVVRKVESIIKAEMRQTAATFKKERGYLISEIAVFAERGPERDKKPNSIQALHTTNRVVFAVPPSQDLVDKLAGMHPWPEQRIMLNLIRGTAPPARMERAQHFTMLHVPSTMNLADENFAAILKGLGTTRVVWPGHCKAENALVTSTPQPTGQSYGKPSLYFTTTNWARSPFVHLEVSPAKQPQVAARFFGPGTANTVAAPIDLVKKAYELCGEGRPGSSPAQVAEKLVAPATPVPLPGIGGVLLANRFVVIPYEPFPCERCSSPTDGLAQAVAVRVAQRGFTFHHDFKGYPLCGRAFDAEQVRQQPVAQATASQQPRRAVRAAREVPAHQRMYDQIMQAGAAGLRPTSLGKRPLPQ
eukprot:tig00021532_g22202.t1